MDPAEWERIRFSARGISPSSSATRLHRKAASPGAMAMPAAAASIGERPVK